MGLVTEPGAEEEMSSSHRSLQQRVARALVGGYSTCLWAAGIWSGGARVLRDEGCCAIMDSTVSDRGIGNGYGARVSLLKDLFPRG